MRNILLLPFNTGHWQFVYGFSPDSAKILAVNRFHAFLWPVKKFPPGQAADPGDEKKKKKKFQSRFTNAIGAVEINILVPTKNNNSNNDGRVHENIN